MKCNFVFYFLPKKKKKTLSFTGWSLLSGKSIIKKNCCQEPFTLSVTQALKVAKLCE